MNSADRRTTPRRPADFLMNAWDSAGVSVCRALDVSEHGMRLERLQGGRRPFGALVEIEFEIPGDRRALTVVGRRVRTDDPRTVSLHFVSVPAAARARLRHFAAHPA